MQNKYISVAILFIILAIPLSSVHATYYCVGIFCNNPYSGVDDTIQQLQLQTQLNSLQQTQSNQSTKNSLILQYGSDAYNHCMSTNFDQGNQAEVAIHLNAATSCMASYKSQTSSTQQTQQNQLDAGCKSSYGSAYNTPGTGGCSCLTGYQWGWNKDLGHQYCVAQNSTNQTATVPSSVSTTATTPTKTSKSSGLTAQQINAILSLLSSFGADSKTIASVSAALGQ